MISISEALTKIEKNTTQLRGVKKDLIDSLNYYLFEDIFSPIDLPPFNQSAMDGYAISSDELKFKNIGEIKAGDTNLYSLKKGESIRIFTGAMIPENTYAIAKQEIVNAEFLQISLTEKISQKTSVRIRGEELQKGELVLKKNTKINPAAIGLLSGLGIQKVHVYSKPKITLVVTGDELTKSGEELKPGKIYESNSYALRSALKDLGFDAIIKFVKDDFFETKQTIDSVIKKSDLVVITGGISVGDYDFVGKALDELNVNEVFYKVNQKPGKPIYYGLQNDTSIFALPGNPAAALTCFYMYVLTAINIMQGDKNPQLIKGKVKILHDYNKKGNREHLLKAQIIDNTVKIHSGQSSAMLSSFVNANCLLHLDADTFQVNTGNIVTTYLLP